MFRRRDVELVVEDRIARRIFVDVGGTVADPLPRDKDRQFDVILDLAHLERGRMAVDGLRNKRCGPGGGTRRLHQFPSVSVIPIATNRARPAASGGEIGSTRVVKAMFSLGMIPPLSGQKPSCER